MGTREDIRSDDLPWGWWLRATDRGLQDLQGAVWPDVRAAFWEGRLGMRSAHLAAEQQELLLRVLGAVDAGWFAPSESRDDLFGGDLVFWRFYLCWLGSVGLTVASVRSTALEAPLSPEGRAALKMLRFTRDPALVDLPMPEVVDAVRRAGRGQSDDAREAALRAFERSVDPMPYVFARERVGRAFLVTLTSIDLRERMPTKRVTWSASFLDEAPRDDLFGWLAERVHRWEDWVGITRARGAHALTLHLLALLVAHPVAGVGPKTVWEDR